MAEHTPGPWSVETAECSDGGMGWTEWCVTSSTGPVCSEVFTEANARLLAAAPDLFNAAANLIRAFDTPVHTSYLRQQLDEDIYNAERALRAAIARAKGRES